MKTIIRFLCILSIVLSTTMATSCATFGNKAGKTVKCTKGKSKVKAKKFASKINKTTKRSVSASKPAASPARPSAQTPPIPPAQQPVETAAIEEPPVLVEEQIVEKPVIISEPAPEPQNDIEHTPQEKFEEQLVVEQTISTPEKTEMVEEELPASKEIIIVKEEPLPPPATKPKPKPTPTYNFKGRTIEKTEKFSFNQHIDFIPNHDVFLDDADAKKKLGDLAKVLKLNPDMQVTIIGNVGWDNFDESRPQDYEYYMGGFMNMVPIEIHYGRGEKVYDQTLPVSDLDYANELMRRGIAIVDEVHVGTVMKARANQAKRILVGLGVNKKQVRTGRGTFFKSSKRHLTFQIRQM